MSTILSIASPSGTATTVTPTSMSANSSLDAPAPAGRRLSGFKPTGRLHLGNYLGAVRGLVEAQHDTTSVVMIADLHALTVEHDPQRLRGRTDELLATLLAAGVDPEATLCYVQSDVPEHAELHYLLECATGYGEAARMVAFKQVRATSRRVRLSLLTYPVLMAADILLHDADEVPVGNDQTQHVELARAVAHRFNTRYGTTFVVPKAVNPAVAARVMDLADPTGKMGKSSTSDAGVVYLLDDADMVRRKVARAVTDAHGEVADDPQHRPGVSNLVEILAACTREHPDATARRYPTYADLKQALAQTIVDIQRPLRARYAELVAEPGYLSRVRTEGAHRARDRAAQTVRRAKRAIGLSH